MKVWNQRPIEVANLLNPAFCSVLISRAISGYILTSQRGMPYSLIFLIPPIILHESTRISLPQRFSPNSKLHAWIHNNPQIKAEIRNRIISLNSYTREALIFGLQRRVLMINDQGVFINNDAMLKKPKWAAKTEPLDCYSKALQLGKWFGITGDDIIIYTLLGIQP